MEIIGRLIERKGMQIDRAFMYACVAACNSGRIAENHEIRDESF